MHTLTDSGCFNKIALWHSAQPIVLTEAKHTVLCTTDGSLVPRPNFFAYETDERKRKREKFVCFVRYSFVSLRKLVAGDEAKQMVTRNQKWSTYNSKFTQHYLCKCSNNEQTLNNCSLTFPYDKRCTWTLAAVWAGSIGTFYTLGYRTTGTWHLSLKWR